jgi:hypothetical protein
MTLFLKLGAKRFTASIARSAAASRSSSHERPSGSRGAKYWQNIEATCCPAGARLSSSVLGISTSTTGARDMPAARASVWARSM